MAHHLSDHWQRQRLQWGMAYVAENKKTQIASQVGSGWQRFKFEDAATGGEREEVCLND